MMLCTIVIVSTVGNFFVTRDAFAQEQQQQLQTHQASVIPYNSPFGATAYLLLVPMVHIMIMHTYHKHLQIQKAMT
ncbi:MAG: hypothetical protein WAJ93_12565 [Candidatus Nitrosopolaris sp.]